TRSRSWSRTRRARADAPQPERRPPVAAGATLRARRADRDARRVTADGAELIEGTANEAAAQGPAPNGPERLADTLRLFGREALGPYAIVARARSCLMLWASTALAPPSTAR